MDNCKRIIFENCYKNKCLFENSVTSRGYKDNMTRILYERWQAVNDLVKKSELVEMYEAWLLLEKGIKIEK